MQRRLLQIISNRITALSWTIFIFILLALPGKMLPEEDHLSIPQLDKFVHMILFGCFVLLWSYYSATKKEPGNQRNSRFILILIIACIYGAGMEFIQKYFIPNRDFDVFDIAADVTGAVIGYIIVRFTADRLKVI
jgi:VanZ family protein